MSQNSISIASGHYRVGLLHTLFVQMFFFSFKFECWYVECQIFMLNTMKRMEFSGQGSTPTQVNII